MHRLSPSKSPLLINRILAIQLEPLHKQLNFLTSQQYSMDRNVRNMFIDKLKKLFVNHFKISLSPSIQQRAIDEKNLIQSIRRQLKQNNLILRRTADQNNTYYLGCANDFERKINDYMDYMINSDSYHMIGTIDKNYPPPLPQLLDMIQWIDSKLNNYHQREIISNDHLSKMCPKKVNVQLPYLYFLPEQQQQSGYISIQSIVSSTHQCPIQPLAHYLNELLQPLYESSAQSTTFSNGTDFIVRLFEFEQDRLLLPGTRFVTLKICNFYSLISHNDSIEALGRFLSEGFTLSQLDNLSIDAIQRLTKLVLSNNLFTFNGHVYRHMIGSPLSLPLTRTLGNIYLRDFLRPLTRQLLINDQFYGRYNDRVFFTWNDSNDKLETIINELNQKHKDIRITRTIGSSIHFLDAYIEKLDGSLSTYVYHDPNSQSYILPYVIGHPRLIYRQWFRWALKRAVCYCTSVEAFDEERLNIELTFLTNGYSLDFVNLHIKKFFNRHRVDALVWGLDRRVYEPFRRRLIESIKQEEKHKFRQIFKSKNELFHLHYLYDWGPRCQFKDNFNQLWLESFKNDSIFAKLKVKLDTIHCYTSNALLAQEASVVHIK